jgi:hypothetical protein
MTAIYGHKWSSQYGDYDMDDTWLYGLRDITNEQIGAGVQRCIDSKDEWAPTLPEFKARCKPTSYPYHNNTPALPIPDVPKERKLGYIEEMRKSLK